MTASERRTSVEGQGFICEFLQVDGIVRCDPAEALAQPIIVERRGKQPAPVRIGSGHRCSRKRHQGPNATSHPCSRFVLRTSLSAVMPRGTTLGGAIVASFAPNIKLMWRWGPPRLSQAQRCGSMCTRTSAALMIGYRSANRVITPRMVSLVLLSLLFPPPPRLTARINRTLAAHAFSRHERGYQFCLRPPRW